ncbi:MAG: hypothetical protein IJQ34_07120 [Kiritimatiellae bacterium]|nr:hypothetical protein [Kiritimatiellia bacterium]
MKLKLTDEMKASMAATKAEMDKAMEDPSFRVEVDAIKASYAAQDLVSSALRSAKRKIDAFRKNYHRDFVVTVSIDDELYRPAELSSRELALA